ncbi:dipeptidase [Salegentibacter mishustinae]|uniref:Peptidase M19 n=1 Tax=Salegentibacter mishustinae TaxID=270918 RepID=A0A0Q9ZCL6_9FLAO|nr:dipeptidase [Salegentibacter mishustinae]KRG27162.1 peptidase M19 [Salegentibacter mishustinae]PNW21396.1 peptidase M19 [Salegentibacter mishustinae]PZX62662.1 membrane dipeptidase/D-alanyl-D-alanine dipeptidase [Salegentibacter mishustinae]GGW97381.1 peptidase M19 [Salegentibacter mishustinae]
MKLNLFRLALLFTGSLAFAQENNDQALLEKAQEIHENVITIDTHADININNFKKERNYTMDLGNQVTLPKMEAGGLDVAWFIVYTGQDELTEEGFKNAYENAMSKFDAIHKLVEDFAPNQIGLATNSQEVRKLVSEGKKVAMIGVENGYSVGLDVENVEKFYDLGARYMSLAHQGHSQLSDSNTGEENDEWMHNGLSDLGKEVIAEMNRLGMMIDVSHPSKEAIKQMFELSKAPLIASHSSARELCNHSRNLDDELLMLFKKHGGVVQTVAFSAYVNTEKDKAFSEASEKVYEEKAAEMNFEILPRDTVRALSNTERNAYYADYQKVRNAASPDIELLKEEIEPVGVSDFVDHIDYMVDLIGIEHVGISSDFDGGGGIDGWEDASETLNITKELVKRGYTEEEIAKLWGENLLRVMDEVDAVAAELQKA